MNGRPRDPRNYGTFVNMFGSAVVSQALLSATSLVISLILIRQTTDHQYGYYVLASSAMILLASLQNAFFNPPLAMRLPRLDGAGRRDLIGGLYREQRRIATPLGGAAAVIVAAFWSIGVLETATAVLVLTTLAAAGAVLNREYLRMVLFAQRHANAVLRSDALHVLLLIAGVLLATVSSAPATVAVLALGVAALASGTLLSRALRRLESWNMRGTPGILREIAPLAAWSTLGAAIHWTFSQGYAYLVAGTLDLTAVAAIAATRLTVMPVNLLSSGIGVLMLPMVSRWLHAHDAARVLRRLMIFASGIAGVSLCYLASLWLLRDWIFADLLHKQIAQRDQLLMLWSVTFLVMVFRDQLLYFLAARGMFRTLTPLALLSAVSSLGVSYYAMRKLGATGAPVGVLVGEVINLAGIVVLSCREAARTVRHPELATGPMSSRAAPGGAVIASATSITPEWR